MGLKRKNGVIGCIVVTFNRLGKLKKTLECYAQQNLLPRYLIVVNNASSDGTKEFLEEWENVDQGFEKIVINSNENLGGSGGFYLGEKKAVQLNAPWIMLGDDDAYPAVNYLEGMNNYIITHNTNELSIVCGRVIERGVSENVHRTFWKSKWDRAFHYHVPEKYYKLKEFQPDFVSYVGPVINRNKLKKVGLVDKNNFIWCDDTEHTYRLSQVGKLVCLPQYAITHDVDKENNKLSWKTYYGIRNDLIFFKKHFPMHYPFIIGKMFCKTLLCPLRGKSFTEVKIRLAAIRDSLLNHMGKNEVYKPGWKP